SLGTFFCSKYLGQTSEIVYLMLLNNKMQMIDCVKMHEGSVNSVGLSIRKIVETALTKNAASVVLAHNHPGGRPFPSTDDLNTTRLVRDALSNVGVDMVAHILVAENKYIDILENS
ncbi:MAG: JAB domain-containing protein, partial [Clostridiales bacterium]|nr:JAB domain-containing protein [Clostridiales bacterium]